MTSYATIQATKNAMAFNGNAYAGWLRLVANVNPLASNFLNASATMVERAVMTYEKPEFDLKSTRIGNRIASVEEKVISSPDKPYCDLRHFKRDTKRRDPKILLVAPMSGHYATLLRNTVEALLPNHEVYVTDWKNARDVPTEDGKFSLDNYVEYIQGYIRELGDDTHVMAVCQPTVAVIAAISLMAQNGEKTPLSMTLMGGPIDTRAAPTAVTEFALKHDLNWFKNNLIQTVPNGFDGVGQRVYPGHTQLPAFVSMNPESHAKSHKDMFLHLCKGDFEAADKLMHFYDEYMAVADIPADFYLDTIDQVFLRQTLANGEMVINGQLVDPSKIKNTAILTIEGENDDISAPGQTIAAHGICSSIPQNMRFNHLQADAGHYGIFSGRKWRENIVQRVAGFVRDSAEKRDITYSRTAQKSAITPMSWKNYQASVNTTNSKPQADKLELAA